MAVQLLDQAWGYRPCWLPSLPAPLLACPPWLGLAGTVVIRLEKYTRQRDEAETSSRLHWHLFQSLTSPRPFHHVLNEHARTLENIVLEYLRVWIHTNTKINQIIHSVVYAEIHGPYNIAKMYGYLGSLLRMNI